MRSKWRETKCSHRCSIHKERVKFHEEAAAFFGVGLLVDVGVQETQLGTKTEKNVKTGSSARAPSHVSNLGIGYQGGGVKLRNDVMQEDGEVGGPTLEQVDALEAAALPVHLKQKTQKRALGFRAKPRKTGFVSSFASGTCS